MIKRIIEKLTTKNKTIITKQMKVDFKGTLGETRQEIRLHMLDRDNYKTINNIIIQGTNGTTQIDHLVISRYGIFVIENKNFAGSIYGRESDKVWTQVIANQKNKFYNPVLQNYGHIKSLQEIIKEVNNIHSIIVFSDKATLKKIEVNNEQIKVINENKLLDTIRSIDKLVFTNEEVKLYYNKVLENMSKIDQNINLHIKSVKNNLDEKSKICPKCNTILVERSGKYGKFMGCSNYPKCKYTYNLDKSKVLG